MRRLHPPRPQPSRAAAEARRARIAACGGLAFGVALVAQTAHAAGWDVTPRLSLRAILSDNIDLDPPGEEGNGLVWGLEPALSIHNREEGGRVKLDFDYAPLGLRYGSDTDDRSNGFSHRGQAVANVEAVESHLFLDLRAGATQVSANRNAPQVVDDIAPAGSLDQSFYYGVSPYYLHHLGSVADAEIRYRFDQVLSDGDRPDSVSNGWLLSVNSGSSFPRLGWGLSYDQRTVEYDDEGRDDDVFAEVQARVRYPFNAQWAAFATAGYLDNDYQTSFGGTNGRTWSTGLELTPSERTSFNFGYQDRPIGDNWFFDLKHRRHRTVWTAKYDEDVTTTRDVLAEQQLIPLFDPFGKPILDPLSGAQLLVPIDIPSLTTEVILRKRLDGSVSLAARRTTTTLRIYRDERQYQESGNEDTVTGGTLRISRRLDRATNGVILATWQQSQYEPESEEQTLWNVGLRLNHDLGPDLRGTLELRHQENAADQPENEYRENRITAGLTYTF